MSVMAKCIQTCTAPVNGGRAIKVEEDQVVSFDIDEFDPEKYKYLKFFEPTDIFDDF